MNEITDILSEDLLTQYKNIHLHDQYHVTTVTYLVVLFNLHFSRPMFTFRFFRLELKQALPVLESFGILKKHKKTQETQKTPHTGNLERTQVKLDRREH